MNAKPLKKELYEKAKELGIDKITLEFSGGSDEGYLYVYTEGRSVPRVTQPDDEVLRKKIRQLESDIDEWVWTVYEYSGAGDGTSYGDTITYDLKNEKMSTQEWAHVVEKGEELDDTLVTR